MNALHVTFLILTVAVATCNADETNLILTVDGITYSNVTFGTVTPSSVSIRHSSGVARLPLAKLPVELQERFGYNPEKAKEWNVARQKADAEATIALHKAYAEANAARQKAEADAEAKKRDAEKAKSAGCSHWAAWVLRYVPRGYRVGIW